MAQVRHWASTDLPVLLLGETGTGKSMLARQMHTWSQRASCLFVEVDCGAVPDSLVEREFFGHEKGAFTGATGRSDGAFKAANHGTILLDDVQNLSPHAQTCLLGVLDTHTICPVGGHARVRLDIRTLATSNRNLHNSTDASSFRPDLYQRLNHIVLRLTPLREQRSEIVALATQWATRLSDDYQRPCRAFSADARRALHTYDWPGNLRELNACLRRAILCGKTGDMTADQLFDGSDQTTTDVIGGPSPSPLSSPILPYGVFRTETDVAYFQRLIAHTNGCVARATQLAKLSQSTLYRIVGRLGLSL